MEKNFLRKGADILVLGSIILSGCKSIEPSVPTVHIPGGIGRGGRTAEEVDRVYEECQEMAVRTNQQGICDPKEAVFGDVSPMWEAPMPEMRVMTFEYPGKKGVMPQEVTFEEAQQICVDMNGEIPIDKVWESIARGPNGDPWPWGNESPSEEGKQANIDTKGGNYHRSLEPSGSRPNGETPNGVDAMVGNVSEWVRDSVTGAPERKGGGAGTYTSFAYPAHQLTDPTPETVAGFRCVFPEKSSLQEQLFSIVRGIVPIEHIR